MVDIIAKGINKRRPVALGDSWNYPGPLFLSEVAESG